MGVKVGDFFAEFRAETDVKELKAFDRELARAEKSMGRAEQRSQRLGKQMRALQARLAAVPGGPKGEKRRAQLEADIKELGDEMALAAKDAKRLKSEVAGATAARPGLEQNAKSQRRFNADMKLGATAALGIGSALLGLGAAAAAGLGAAVAALATMSQEVSKTALDVERLAVKTGATTDEIQQLSFALTSTGGKADDIGDILATVADKATDALADSTSSMAEDFRVVGLRLDELKGKRPIEQFLAFADAVAKTEDEGAQLTSTVRILGDDLGLRTLSLLRQGSAGFDELAASATNAGVVMSGEALEAASRYRQRQVDLNLTLMGLRQELGLAFLPVLESVTEGLERFIRDNREGAINTVSRWVERFTESLEVVEDIFDRLDFLVVNSVGGWIELFETLGRVLFTAVAVPFTIASIPFIATAAAVAGLLLALDDLLALVTGGKSVTGEFLSQFEFGAEVVAQLQKNFQTLVDAGGSVLRLLGAIAKLLDPLLAPLRELADETLDNVINKLSGDFADTLEFILSLLEKSGAAFEFVASGVDTLASAIDGASLGGLAGDVLGGLGVPQAVAASAGAQFDASLAGPAPAAPPGVSSTSVSISQGPTTFQGSNLSEEQVRNLVRERDEEARRAAAAAIGPR